MFEEPFLLEIKTFMHSLTRSQAEVIDLSVFVYRTDCKLNLCTHTFNMVSTKRLFFKSGNNCLNVI